MRIDPRRPSNLRSALLLGALALLFFVAVLVRHGVLAR